MPDKQSIYVDNAATTRLDPAVLEAMMPHLTGQYGNPSSLYGLGFAAQTAITQARTQVAAALGAAVNEIYFTSGGSESDNWAIKGAAALAAKKGKTHIISTAFEHHAVLHTLRTLERQGFTVTLLPVHENGLVRLEELAAAIRPETGLVSVMYANNEIGTVQPIEAIGALCRERGVLFHTDAVQAVGQLSIDLSAMQVDLLSLSAHKFHGPKGVGALYCRKGIFLPALIDGGAQERGRRAGTENTAGIVGMGAAITLATADLPGKAAHLLRLRERLIDGALLIERSRLNGDRNCRLAGNASFCFEGIEGESLLLMLDQAGIAASSGSACTSGSLDPSHVLLSLGLPHEIAHGSLRVTFSEENTEQDVDAILAALRPIIVRLRAMSPLWERIIKGEGN